MPPFPRPRAQRATEHRVEMELSPGPGAAALARGCLERLRGSMPSRVHEDLRVVASELVTNCVLHAGLSPGQVIVVRVEVGDDLTRVEVEDPGRGFGPRPAPPAADAAGGRGLMLVERIAARWGILRTQATHVWAEIDHGGGSPQNTPRYMEQPRQRPRAAGRS